MMMRLSHALCAVLLLVAAAGTAKAAELVVITSTAPGLQPGQIIDGSRTIGLPAGSTVTLISEYGTPITLTGPYEGVPAASAAPGDRNLLAALSRLVASEGGESLALGASRGSAVVEPPGPWVIDVSQSGDHCVPAGGPVRLWRPDARRPGSLRLKAAATGQKSKTAWPKGTTMLDWPQEMELKDGAIYLVQFRGSITAKKLVLHVVPADLPSDANRVAWMAGQGCTKQALSLLARPT